MLNNVTRKPTAPVVLYIAGYGRSGSTVLEMVLSNQSGFLGAGELTHLFRDLASGGHCACGTELRACEVWCGFDRPRSELERTRDLTRKMERRSRFLSPPNGSDSARKAYARTWRHVFDALAARAGPRAIIDSSKTAGAAHRPRLLAQHCGLDVRVIHLVRDPRAVMWSLLRGSNRRLAAGQYSSLRFATLRALAGWMRCNDAAERQIKEGALPAVRVQYESFVARPLAEMQRIACELSLNLDEAASVLRQQGPLRAGHGIAGNRARTSGIPHLRLDDEWTRMLPWHANVLATAAGRLAARYGYDLNG